MQDYSKTWIWMRNYENGFWLAATKWTGDERVICRAVVDDFGQLVLVG